MKTLLKTSFFAILLAISSSIYSATLATSFVSNNTTETDCVSKTNQTNAVIEVAILKTDYNTDTVTVIINYK